jgi:hypothetical protein
MIQRDRFRFLSSYTIAAYLMLATTAIGIVNIFLHGIYELTDTLIALAVVLLRYLSFVLIKRRFDWSRYLLWILLARSIYRVVHVYQLPSASSIYLASNCLQLLLTSLSLYLVYFPLTNKLKAN